MERITRKHLDYVVDAINMRAGTPPRPWSDRDANGKITANVGNYHIGSAYGGWRLEQMMNEGGGIRNVFGIGYVPKRELYGLLQAYHGGLTSKLWKGLISLDAMPSWDARQPYHCPFLVPMAEMKKVIEELDSD